MTLIVGILGLRLAAVSLDPVDALRQARAALLVTALADTVTILGILAIAHDMGYLH